MFTKKIASLAGIVASLTMLLSPVASKAAVTSAFVPGDLIKGTDISTVYYFGPDGHRYVFVNDKTYFTWYTDFTGVKVISMAQLGTIPLGRSNITYRPGYKMVKITTDPKTYVVDQGGVLRWVKTQELAETLYGLNWKNRIDDIPDPFFINYTVGTPIDMASDYHPADVMNATPNISIDKQFDNSNVTVTIGTMENGFVPTTTTIKAGGSVTWHNSDIVPHTVTSAGFDSGSIPRDGDYKRTFTQVGSFDYHCSIHPSMQGTINVVQ
jgi:plastocyanin